MAVPKCKVSSARRDKRRGSNWKLSAPSVAVRSWPPRLTKAGKKRKLRGRRVAFLFFHL